MGYALYVLWHYDFITMEEEYCYSMRATIETRDENEENKKYNNQSSLFY